MRSMRATSWVLPTLAWAALTAILAPILPAVLQSAFLVLQSTLRITGHELVLRIDDTTAGPIGLILGAYIALATVSVIRAKRENRGQSVRKAPVLLIYTLLAIPVLLVGVFSYIPASSAIYHAFTQWDVGADPEWVGGQHFATMLQDPVLHESFWNLARLGIFVFIAHMTMPLVVAELIYHLRSERSRYLCRVLVVLPMVVPGVVMFLLWGYIYSDAGVLTELLYTLGLREWVRGWLSDPDTALWAIAFVGFPFALGVHVLIYYAGLANISPAIFEAGEIDGLSGWGKIRHLHLPLLVPQARLLTILTLITVVNGFESVLILTGDGGPGYATMVPGLYMYLSGFVYQRMGYACAIGLLLLVGLLSASMAVNRFMRSPAEE